jgi:hypothetical protein
VHACQALPASHPGRLRDLYRVALLGLALSLIAISLAYQRFVLRRPETGSR